MSESAAGSISEPSFMAARDTSRKKGIKKNGKKYSTWQQASDALLLIHHHQWEPSVVNA
jgi:hypothetical protein